MAWSYSGDPSANLKDQCRFLIGDTDENDVLLQNEEITFLINDYGDTNLLRYHLFERAATKLARTCGKKSLGPQMEDTTERIKYYKDMAKQYKAQAFSAGLSEPAYARPKVFGVDMQSNPPWRS